MEVGTDRDVRVAVKAVTPAFPGPLEPARQEKDLGEIK